MLPGIGLSEFLLIAVVALIVVGPKDLPLMMRKLGRMVGKARSMASEFRHAFDDIARQAELDELRKEIEAIKRDNVMRQAAADLRAAEADINAAVMARSPASASPEPEVSAGTTVAATESQVRP